MSDEDALPSLGAEIETLAETIRSKRGGDPAASYTAKLLAKGPGLCAKKLGEEAVEAALAIAAGPDADVAQEAADLLYHLLVALAARDVPPSAVAAVLIARQAQSGLAEKAARSDGNP